MVEEKNLINFALGFFKRFWEVFAAGFAAASIVFLFLHFDKKDDDVFLLIKKMQDSHSEEVKKLYELREEEKKKLEDIEKKYDEKIGILEEEYKKSKEIFEEKKKDKAEKIVRDFDGKPKELADRLSQATGFTVILPEE